MDFQVGSSVAPRAVETKGQNNAVKAAPEDIAKFLESYKRHQAVKEATTPKIVKLIRKILPQKPKTIEQIFHISTNKLLKKFLGAKIK